MSSRPGERSHGWQDDWVPPRWGTPEPDPAARRHAAREFHQPRPERRRPIAERPSDRPVELLQLAIAPAVTAALAILMWIVSPLPGAGPSPAPMLLIALAQVAGSMITREDRPLAARLPWLTHLAATVGLLPLLAIQVSLLREPYVALGQGSAWPAVVATLVAMGFSTVLAVSTTVRFWRQPDQAVLVFLPSALLILAAIGQRSQITISAALAILAFAMGLGAIATVVAAPLSLGMRLLVPPVTLALEIVVLWASGRGPVSHETSGAVVRVLYLMLLFSAVALVILVPVLAVWLRKSSAMLADAPARRMPRA